MSTTGATAAQRELEDVTYEVDRRHRPGSRSSGPSAERVPRPDRRRADPLLQARLGRRARSAWSCSPAPARALLRRRRPEAARGDRRLRAVRVGLFEVEQLHRIMRAIPKPVIAAVNGVAIGGGHVLHVLGDLTIAADTRSSARTVRASARSTPASAPPTSRGWSARSARARSGTCAAATTPRRPSAGASSTRSCPLAELRAEVRRWADEMLALSPTALRFLKQSFNADSEQIARHRQLAFSGLAPVRRVRRGGRGHARVRREAAGGLRPLPGGRVGLTGAARRRRSDRCRAAALV